MSFRDLHGNDFLRASPGISLMNWIGAHPRLPGRAVVA